MEEDVAKSRSSLISSSLLIMVLTHVLVHAAGNMMSTLLPVLEGEFSLTNQQIGLIVAIPSLSQLLFSVPTGFFSDRFGAKKLLTLSILLAAAGAFLGSISNNPWMYIVATTLLTLNTTIYHPPSQSYVSKITNPKDRSRALGIWHAGGTTGFSLGPLSITILMGVFAFNWRQVYGFWVLPILLGLVALYFVKPTDEMVSQEAKEDWEEEDTVETLLNRNMIFLLLSGTIRRFGGGLTAGFLTIWLAKSQGWSIFQIGLMLGVSSLMGIVASPLGGELASKFGEKRWLVATLFVSYTCFMLAIVLKGFWPFMLFYLAQRFFGILGMPANMTITSRLSPSKQRGVGFALSSIPENVIKPLAAIVAAYMADYLGLYYPIFLATAMIYFVGLAVLQFGVKLD
ncbi:MFS transporter [Candidatus Bathyarchaeota archaeon]|nr:MAG: MFS transporter [Candidatus Bathyarchaeota archaeon]